MDLEHNIILINQPLLHRMNKIYENLNKPQPEFTLGLFLDLKNAFDCCDSNILFKKLKYYGVIQKCS